MGEGDWAELKSEKDWSWEGDLRAGGNGRKEWKEQRSRSWQEDNLTPLHIAANSATVYYPKFTWNKEEKSSCRESSRIIPIPPVRHPAQRNWAPRGCLGAGHAHHVHCAPPSLCQCRALCAVTFPTKYTQPHTCICTLHSFLALPQNPWVPAGVQAQPELETAQGQRQKHLRRLLTVHQAGSWAECPCSSDEDSLSNESVTEGVRKAFRHRAYSHSDSVLLPGKCSVKDLFPGCKYMAFKNKEVHGYAFLGPKLWKLKNEKPLLCSE